MTNPADNITEAGLNFYHSPLKLLDKQFAGQLDFVQNNMLLDAYITKLGTDDSDAYEVSIYGEGYGKSPTKCKVQAFAMSPFDDFGLWSPCKCIFKNGLAFLYPGVSLFTLLVAFDGDESYSETPPDDAYPIGAAGSDDPFPNLVSGWPCNPTDLSCDATIKKNPQIINCWFAYPYQILTEANPNKGTYAYMCIRFPQPQRGGYGNPVGLVLLGASPDGTGEQYMVKQIIDSMNTKKYDWVRAHATPT